MRRGFVFTLDAILSLVLVMIFVTSIVNVLDQSNNVYSTYLRSENRYTAESVLLSLRTVPLNQLVPESVVANWTEKGILDTRIVSPDMSPLDVVATYWATAPIYPDLNLTHKAEIILGYILNRTLPGYDYQLIINNYTGPYLTKAKANYSLASDVSSATVIINGYAYNQTPRGYMARAYLTRATYVRSDLFGWMRVLAGGFSSSGYSNSLNVVSTINIPTDSQKDIYEANGNFVHRFLEQEDVYINGKHVPLSNTEPNAPDIRKYLVPGKNIIRMYFHDSAYYGSYYRYTIGIGSGTTMYVKYKSNSLRTNNPGLIKVYNVTSEYTGFIYLLESFVPGNITGINMVFKVKGAQVVRLYYGLGARLYLLLEKKIDPNSVQTVEFTNSEIKNALASIGVSYKNLSKMVFDFVVAIDAKYYTSDGQFHYGGASYYSYSCPTSECGGERERVLYGYPDSYVQISYIPRTVITRYSIPLSIPIGYDTPTYSGYTGYHCGGDTYKTMTIKYNLPPNAIPWYADLWVGYCFDNSTTQYLKENGNTFYSGPNGVYALRIAYSKIYPWMMRPGSNTFTAELKTGVNNGGTSFRYQATRGIIKYFIEAYAGYGDVFPYMLQGYPTYRGYNLTYYYSNGTNTNEGHILVGDPPYKPISVDDLNPLKYAVDDAVLRLFNNLNYIDDKNPGEWRIPPYDGSQQNPIDVYLPESVKIEISSMGNIPGMFTPVQITLRIWRER